MLHIVCSVEAAFKHFECLCSCFPRLRAEFDADTLFFQVCHFLGTTKSQLEQHIVLPNKTLHSNNTFYSLVPGGK